MASNGKHGFPSYAPSAPSLPESYRQQYSQGSGGSYGYGQQHSQGNGGSYSYGQQQGPSSYGHSGFPPGTDPAVISSFQMVDRDRSGFIDDNELQQALSSGYQRFSLRTIRLLIFLFKSPNDPLRVGEFLFFFSSKWLLCSSGFIGYD